MEPDDLKFKELREQARIFYESIGKLRFWSVMPDWSELRISKDQVLNVVGDRQMEDE